MIKGAIVIPRVWRSEIMGIGAFLVFSLLSIVLSQRYPSTVITGYLISIGSYRIFLSLPLLWFVPLVALGSSMYSIYNGRYVVYSRGSDARMGILSLRPRIPRVRYEDIRSVETEQSVLDRMLDIGEVEIGTAATSNIEIMFLGVGAPKEVQDMIQSERDRRQKIARQGGSHPQERARAL